MQSTKNKNSMISFAQTTYSRWDFVKIHFEWILKR
jgi:hypothetical protein